MHLGTVAVDVGGTTAMAMVDTTDLAVATEDEVEDVAGHGADQISKLKFGSIGPII